MNKETLLSFKENDCFKLFADSPLYWRVTLVRPISYVNALRAVCVNGDCHIASLFSYDTLVYRYEA